MRLLQRLRKTRDGQNAENGSNTQRIEAFSDGVFAIAITLMVLEIHFPRLTEAEPGAHLRAALLSLWPAYFAYVLSFVMVGIYWANHHYIFRLYQKTDHAFNLLNVLFLMCISFLPLPTAVLGEYLLDEHKRQTAIIFYNFGLFLPAFSWFLMWAYARRGDRLLDPRLEPQFVAYLGRQYLLSVVFYLISIAAAFCSGLLGVCVSVGLTCLYLLPPKTPIYRADMAGKEEGEARD